MEFVDTHCHLDDGAFGQDLPAVLDAARAAGVRHFVNIGYEPRSWERSLELAHTFPDVSYVLGMHPNSAELWNPETAAQLERLLEQARPVAIGETGLDFYRERADHGVQRQAFRDQLMLGRCFDLPVIIHMRGSVEDEIIANLADFPDVRVILHSFDGSATLRDFLLARGDVVGVGGLMTRAASTDLREVLRSVPLESIVLETDSPYLVPKGVKERRNTPVSIPLIAATLADLLGRSVQEISRQTTANAHRLLGLPELARTEVAS